MGLENLGCDSAGELFFIGYQMDKKPPCVWYSGLDKDGQLQFDVKVDLKEGVMMHDMAITQASSHCRIAVGRQPCIIPSMIFQVALRCLTSRH